MFQRILDKLRDSPFEKVTVPFLMLVIVFLIVIITIISQIKIHRFSYERISEEVKNIKINKNMLKEYKFPRVSTQIFSPLIIQQQKIDAPKILILPPVIKESPKDPYEKYRNELKGYVGLGLMNQGGKTKVFLAKGEETLILGIGDIITDKLFIKEITENNVTVGLTDDPQFQETIRINK